jgi:DNA-binding XRE family transcriptional regulator
MSGRRGLNLSKLLQAARAGCALTQADLAARLGRSTRTIARWEAGRTAPGVAEVRAVASVLRSRALAKHVREYDRALADRRKGRLAQRYRPNLKPTPKERELPRLRLEPVRGTA